MNGLQFERVLNLKSEDIFTINYGFTGHHKIDVLHCDKPVLGSPFKCDAFDASKVKLEKIKLNNLVVNKRVTFERMFHYILVIKLIIFTK